MAAVQERPPTVVAIDERAARRTLRAQIARLERHLAAVGGGAPRALADAGPRLLDLGELEATRDALAVALRDAQDAADARARRRAQAWAALEAMRAAPREHKWRQIADADLGLPGCGRHHVRPRLGLLGMVLGWWRVKVSSGCPLASAPPEWVGASAIAAPSPWGRRRARPRPRLRASATSVRARRGTRSRSWRSRSSPGSSSSSSAC